MLVPLLVIISIILLYYELLSGCFSRYLTHKRNHKIQRKRLEAVERAHKIADRAIMEGVPRDKLKPKKIKCGNSTIDVEEIYDALLEVHLRVV